MSSSSSSIDTSSEYEEPPKKIKRSFGFLYPEFKQDDVCERTLRKYQSMTASSSVTLSNLDIQDESLVDKNCDGQETTDLTTDHSTVEIDEILASKESDEQCSEFEHGIFDATEDQSDLPEFAHTEAGDEILDIFFNSNDRIGEYEVLNDAYRNIEIWSEHHGSDSEQSNSNSNSDYYSENSDDYQNVSNCEFDDNAAEDERENDESPFYNKIMFNASNLTMRDVIALCSSYTLRFHHSDEAQLELMNIFKFCAGPAFNDVNISKYMISKCFSTHDKLISYHYYCIKCKDKILYSVNVEQKHRVEIVCEKCKKRYPITLTANNYFLSVDLSYQLKLLLNDNDIFDDIMKNVQLFRENRSDPNIKGVYNSVIYKNIVEHSKQNLNDKLIILTLNGNTDGAPTTRSGKTSSWGITLTLNELSLKLMSKYILLAGMLLVRVEPDSEVMNLYLSKFVEQINNLCQNGIEIERENGEVYTFKFYMLAFFVDTVCRRIMQNRMQFNAYSGCSWCYQIGIHKDAVSGIRYVFSQMRTERTHETHLQDMRIAVDEKRVVRGVKGESALQKLPCIDLVWSLGYEYMHTLCLGKARQIFNEWKRCGHIFYLKPEQLKKIEERFLRIKPTQDIQRLPRPGVISGKMKKKASEEKFWLLGPSLPCLKGILNEEALEHYSLLVKCAYTLLQLEITQEELNQCEIDLLHFVGKYEMYYGPEQMTFNIHAALHIVKSIRMTGPLCYNSAFMHESYIRTLKNFIAGPNGMDYQMTRKHLLALIFKTKNTKSTLLTSKDTQEYCSKLFMPKKLTTFYEKNEDGVTFFGRGCLRINELGNCIAYKKCIFQSIVYHSIQYSRPLKTDDTVIQLKLNDYCRIVEILDFNDHCYLRLSAIEVYIENAFCGVTHIKKIKHEKDSTDNFLKPITEVLCKVIYMEINENEKYLCTLPNIIEVH